MIPYGRQSIDHSDVDAVVDVLKSDFLTQGPQVPRFEKALTELTGAQHAVAVNSGTSALHIACLALGLSKGDWLWTTPISFVASANCGLYCGAHVDFVDIDPRTNNLCPDVLEKKLIAAEKSGSLPKVVVAVHLAGIPCDMVRIQQLSKQYGFAVIEDACHAIGGKYQGQPIGSCTYSDITVFSFHPVKIITTGEGGAALTNDAGIAKKMASLACHGITRDQNDMNEASHGPWYYQQLALGFNYRMTDIQAALGVSQLKRISHFVDSRLSIVSRYNDMLASLPLSLPVFDPDTSYHLYIVRLQLDAVEYSHKEVFEKLREKGVGVNLHYIPIYKQPVYQALETEFSSCPHAEQYYQEAISLPIYPELSESDQLIVVDTLKSILVKD